MGPLCGRFWPATCSCFNSWFSTIFLALPVVHVIRGKPSFCFPCVCSLTSPFYGEVSAVQSNFFMLLPWPCLLCCRCISWAAGRPQHPTHPPPATPPRKSSAAFVGLHHLICVACCPLAVHVAEELLSWSSIGILGLFATELLAKLVCFGSQYYAHSRWHMFDAGEPPGRAEPPGAVAWLACASKQQPGRGCSHPFPGQPCRPASTSSSLTSLGLFPCSQLQAGMLLATMGRLPYPGSSHTQPACCLPAHLQWW
jgi:hypothetical protein